MKRLWHFNILSKNARLLCRSVYWLGAEKSSLQIPVHSWCLLLLENSARKWRNCRDEKIKSLYTDRTCVDRNYQNMTLKFFTYAKLGMRKVVITCKYLYWFTVSLSSPFLFCCCIFYFPILNPVRILSLHFIFFNPTILVVLLSIRNK